MTTETAEVKGRYESIRKPLHGFLIILFLVMPWIRIAGSPLIMTDIWNRHFIIFGRHFFSHDAPLLFFVVISLVFFIALVTAIWGRIWCGWACPQTVFIASVYQKIELFILGNYLKREKIKKEPLTPVIFIKKALVYFFFILASYIISHSFIAYFVGSDRIVQFIKDGPQDHWVIFICIQVATVLLTINFGWFRQRLCHHVCPYGRFQNVLLDNNSLMVEYLKHVGEPRRSNTVLPAEQGNCIDCHRCVSVCPMKIDIRNGFQLECINCAACIDACDEIMTKIKKPTGLIQLTTADNKPINWKRFRVLLYSFIICIALSFFTVQLMNYRSIEVELSRSRQNAFVVDKIENGKKVMNHFEGHIKNQNDKVLKLNIELSAASLQKGFILITQMKQIELQPLDNREVHIFVSREIKNTDTQPADEEFEIELKTEQDTTIKKFKLLGG